jgi:hypothetical protein
MMQLPLLKNSYQATLLFIVFGLLSACHQEPTINLAKSLEAKQASVLRSWLEQNNLSEDQFKLSDTKLTGSHALMIEDRQLVGLKAKGVRSGDGLASLVSLRSLELSFFEEVQFSQCPPQLETLRINGLPAKSMSLEFLTQCPKLFELQLFHTEVKNWQPLYSLTELQSLSVRFSALSRFQLQHPLSELQRLDLSNNKINNLSFPAAQTQLKSLFLSQNHLSFLPDLSSLTVLENLSLDSNPLLAMSDNHLPPQLTNLDLRKTPLLDFKPLVGLQNLQRIQVQRTPKNLPASLLSKMAAAVRADSQLAIAEDLMQKYLAANHFIEKLPQSVDGKAFGLHKQSSQHFTLTGTSKLSGTIQIDEVQGNMRIPLAQTDDLSYQQRQVMINGQISVDSGTFSIFSPVSLDFWQMAALFVDNPKRQAPESVNFKQKGFIVYEAHPGLPTFFQANLIPMADRYLLLIGSDVASGVSIVYE